MGWQYEGIIQRIEYLEKLLVSIARMLLLSFCVLILSVVGNFLLLLLCMT